MALRLVNPPVWNNQHVTTHSDFVVPNDRNVAAGDAVSMKIVKCNLVWSLQDAVNVVTRDPRYAALNFSIDYWAHSENDVIAKKCHAHGDLSLHEFEAYGSLRAGVKLQMARFSVDRWTP